MFIRAIKKTVSSQSSHHWRSFFGGTIYSILDG
jgi:hypothetical protein